MNEAPRGALTEQAAPSRAAFFVRGLAAYGHPQTVTLRIGELKSLVREVFEAELRANPQHIAVGFLSALDIAKNHKIPAKGRRGIVISISAYMRRHCLKHGFRTRISAETGKDLFPPDAVDHWLLRGGLQVIHQLLVAGTLQVPLQIARRMERPLSPIHCRHHF